MNDEIYSRQSRLREIGVKGQQRLAEGHAILGEDEASKIAADYLSRAGIGSIQIEAGTQTASFVHAQYFSHPGAATFAHGSWLATRKLIEILGCGAARTDHR